MCILEILHWLGLGPSKFTFEKTKVTYYANSKLYNVGQIWSYLMILKAFSNICWVLMCETLIEIIISDIFVSSMALGPHVSFLMDCLQIDV